MRTNYCYAKAVELDVIRWILSDDPRDLVVLSPTKYQAKKMETLIREALSTLITLPTDEIRLGDGRRLKVEYSRDEHEQTV